MMLMLWHPRFEMMCRDKAVDLNSQGLVDEEEDAPNFIRRQFRRKNLSCIRLGIKVRSQCYHHPQIIVTSEWEIVIFV